MEVSVYCTPPSSPFQGVKGKADGVEVNMRERSWQEDSSSIPTPEVTSSILPYAHASLNLPSPHTPGVALEDSREFGTMAYTIAEFVRILNLQDSQLVADVLKGDKKSPEDYVKRLVWNELSVRRWQMSSNPIGQGSSSYVFAIRDAEGDTSLALKIPLSRNKASIMLHEVLIYSYLAQRAKQSLSKMHIVRFYGIAAITRRQFKRLRSNDVVPALVLDMADYTMRSFTQSRTVTKAQWWKFTNDLLLCLQFLRGNAVVHGDIKTANILVQGYDAYLVDFASASITGTNMKKAVETTLQYSSPSLIEGSRPCYDSDLYAAGLCLLTLITRFEPYQELSMLNSHSTHTSMNSLHEKQWLMNAICKREPIKYNVLKPELHQQWAEELQFLERFFANDTPISLENWITEANSRINDK
ncbi:HBL078Wp [Eremothecium sinecaudum]|uniref:non-specific serine/threonine protein kinase n=1 Tax=Eremothecium sinecaudum TaxID=45286 RepID=A0A120K0Y5_9SACH|nr:HBL078Wp [Eremothecium sinecaudum]AMD18824.1 HBL078Wp [Eremothecium sinecaudum]